MLSLIDNAVGAAWVEAPGPSPTRWLESRFGVTPERNAFRTRGATLWASQWCMPRVNNLWRFPFVWGRLAELGRGRPQQAKTWHGDHSAYAMSAHIAHRAPPALSRLSIMRAEPAVAPLRPRPHPRNTL